MQSLREIRALLAERGLHPRKRFGQNFLHDKNLLGKLVEAAAIAPGDLVLEVGPGTGTLTEALLDAGAEVVVSEIDEDLADIIEDRLGARVTLIRGDCLPRQRRLAESIVAAFGDRPFKLVANLPYQVASPLMTALLLDMPHCTGQYVTIQNEVADRLIAPPGGKTYGPLGIIVQALADVTRLAKLPASCFWPAPQVTSAMVSILPRPEHGVEDPHAFARFVTALFGKRRKQLGTTFGRDRSWPDGVTEDQRPETLTIDQVVALWRLVDSPTP
ncbi:MAG: ribosomal RNA small subunit methyltransferase A [Planctomycetes bacterium]|nr:ribosomal RNA small subunit methyltransferase A [Planctomycetota bacterium]